MEEIAKPQELLAARGSAETLFALLREWFDVPDHVTIDLRGVDTAVAELGEPQLVMAMAMRKLQALHLLTTPGVRTTTDVVLTVIQDLERALLQAPNMFLKQTAEATDWDAELAELDDVGSREEPGAAGGSQHRSVPEADQEAADDLTLFRRHHVVLHDAARAVLHASQGQVRVLI